MVGSLPCKTLFELLLEVLLSFDSRDIAQVMPTKARVQVLAQQK